MTKPILLQIGNVTQRMKNRFDALFDVHVWFDQQDQDAFVNAHGADIVGIATDGHWGVPDNLLARLPNLKVVSSYGVGYDAIDADDAADRGILVSHTPNVLNDEVADTAIMLWLATSRRLVQADKWARSGQWEREGSFPLTRSVQKRQVGILMQPSIITPARRRMWNSFITAQSRNWPTQLMYYS
jgi:lactate dehydrogenase-like 2-hydroxyacid dehydrogenase